MLYNAYEYPHLWPNIWGMITDYYATHGTRYQSSGIQAPYHESLCSLSYAYQTWQLIQDRLQAKQEREQFILSERKKTGYITKRDSPQGYVAVTKPLARKLYELGYNVTLAGNNINSYHIFEGWHLGYTINIASAPSSYDPYTKETTLDDFSYIVQSFLSYLDRELGYYCVYYVKETDYHLYKEGTK